MDKQDTISLDSNELEKIKYLKDRQAAVKNSITRMGMAQLRLSIEKDEMEVFHKENITLEKTIGQELMEKYGNGSIDIETETFTRYNK
jgi:hypothetical protein